MTHSAERINDRVSILLSGVKGNRKLKAAVNTLYQTRGQYVHAGEVSDLLCLKTAQVAYIRTFLSLSSKLEALPSRGNEPIRRLIEGK